MIEKAEDKCGYCGNKKNCWFFADGVGNSYPCKEPEPENKDK